MSIIVACRSCGKMLKAPDRLAGKKAKCSQCGGVVLVKTAPLRPVAVPRTAAAPPPPPEPELPMAELWQDPEPVPEVEIDEPAQDEPQEARPSHSADRSKKKKKKKKRPSEESSAPGVPRWVWWVGAMGVLVLGLAIGVVLAVRAGYGELMMLAGIELAILVPISTVILIVSMVLSSVVAGGIDFGEVHIVIPKAMFLLLIINLVMLVPFGPILTFFFTFPIWLMTLFGLDLWESRFLVAINSILNLLVKAFLLGLILHAVTHARSAKDVDEEPAKEPAIPMEQRDAPPGMEDVAPPGDDEVKARSETVPAPCRVFAGMESPAAETWRGPARKLPERIDDWSERSAA
jgi:hypothetical protein